MLVRSTIIKAKKNKNNVQDQVTLQIVRSKGSSRGRSATGGIDKAISVRCEMAFREVSEYHKYIVERNAMTCVFSFLYILSPHVIEIIGFFRLQARVHDQKNQSTCFTQKSWT